jgi:hypothetical protein
MPPPAAGCWDAARIQSVGNRLGMGDPVPLHFGDDRAGAFGMRVGGSDQRLPAGFGADQRVVRPQLDVSRLGRGKPSRVRRDEYSFAFRLRSLMRSVRSSRYWLIPVGLG